MADDLKQASGIPPMMEGWSRDGFMGERAGLVRRHYTPDYISVEGPHAPRRLMIGDVVCADLTQARA